MVNEQRGWTVRWFGLRRGVGTGGWWQPLFLVVLAGVGACGGDGTVDPMGQPEDKPPTSAPESDSVLVPVDGGTFTLLDGDVELRIPAGATGSGTVITVARDSSADASGRAVAGGVFDFGPDGLVFNGPVELRVRLDPSRWSETDMPELVRLHRFEDGEPRLIPGSWLDLEEPAVVGFIGGFSGYGAARAEVAKVVEADRSLAEDADPGDGDGWARLQESVRRDLEIILPLLDGDCRAATLLPVKEGFFRQRGSMAETVELLGLDPGLVPPREDFCGRLLAPGASIVEVEPGPWIRVEPGAEVQLSASVLGPGGDRLFGDMIWAPGDAAVAEVTLDGLLRGVTAGTAQVEVTSVDFPMELAGRVEVVVGAELVVALEPSELVLATAQRGQVGATVTDTASGRVLGSDEAPLAWTVADGEVVGTVFVPGERHGRTTLEGRMPGTTSLTACVFHRDQASGLVTEHSCSPPMPVEVLFSVAGGWVFDEHLTVDVDPPASETCQVVGTTRFEQNGPDVSGTFGSQTTCTFHSGDGSEPEVQSFTAEGRVFQGRVSERELEFVTEATLPGGVIEQCRWTGTFDGEGGIATLAVGFVQCLDEDGFFSEGPSEGRRAGGASQGEPRPE